MKGLPGSDVRECLRTRVGWDTRDDRLPGGEWPMEKGSCGTEFRHGVIGKDSTRYPNATLRLGVKGREDITSTRSLLLRRGVWGRGLWRRPPR
jgi:hypothetical protein